MPILTEYVPIPTEDYKQLKKKDALSLTLALDYIWSFFPITGPAYPQQKVLRVFAITYPKYLIVVTSVTDASRVCFKYAIPYSKIFEIADQLSDSAFLHRSTSRDEEFGNQPFEICKILRKNSVKMPKGKEFRGLEEYL